MYMCVYVCVFMCLCVCVYVCMCVCVCLCVNVVDINDMCSLYTVLYHVYIFSLLYQPGYYGAYYCYYCLLTNGIITYRLYYKFDVLSYFNSNRVDQFVSD